MKSTLILTAALLVGSAAHANHPSRNLAQASNFKLAVTALRDVVALAGACDAKYSAIAKTAVQNMIAQAKDKKTAAERQAVVNQESVKALEALAEVEPTPACAAEGQHLVESGGAIAVRAGAQEKWEQVQAQAQAMLGQ